MYTFASHKKPTIRGVTTLMAIIFMGIFVIILGTITSFAFEEARYGRALYDREQALHSADADERARLAQLLPQLFRTKR